MTQEVAPELDTHLMTELRNLLKRTGVALGRTDQMGFRQRDNFVFRHGELAQTQRRTHTKRAPVWRAAIEHWRQRELFFKRTGEGLLRIKTILQGNIQNGPRGQAQCHRRLGQTTCANIGPDSMTGDILEHPLQMPLGIACFSRHIIQ